MSSHPHPIYAAVKAGDLEKVKAFLKYDPSLVREKGDEFEGTPLHRAADQGQTEIAELLLANGAKIDASDSMGARPLHWAADEDRKGVVELLLAKGVEVDIRDNDGHTALHHAAAKGSREVTKLLLAHQADVNAKGENEKTPLHWAVSSGDKEIAELLIAGQADVNAREKEGYTPLHEAVMHNNQAFVELLLANGADIHARSNTGVTAADAAARLGYEEVKQLLSQHGSTSTEKEIDRTMSAASRAKITEALEKMLADAMARQPKSVPRIDLREDAVEVRQMLENAVGAYAAAHAAPSSAAAHPPVTRIDFVFSLGDSEATPWVHLHIDTKPGSEPDGDPTHPDFARLTRPAWLPAVQSNAEDQTVSVVKQDGTILECAGDELFGAIGNFLVEILLEARAKGLFARLPKADHCELGVEDPTAGAFGWPAYEDRGTSLVG